MNRLCSVLAFAAVLGAQSAVFVPDPDPATGPINAIPLGDKGPTGGFQNMRTQIRVPAIHLPSTGSTITGLAFAAPAAGSYRYTLFEVRLAHLASASLDAEFAKNLAGEAVVLSRREHVLSLPRADAWADAFITGQFVHDGSRDLIVDVIVQGAFYTGGTPGVRRSSTLEHVFALNYLVHSPAASGYGPLAAGAKLRLTLSDGSFIVVGSGCRGSSGNTPAVSASGSTARRATLTINELLARPSSVSLLVLGRSDARFGPVTLPFEMAPLGAPGCRLYTDVVLLLVALTDPGGNASQSLTVPDDPALPGRHLFVQWATLDAGANAAGLSFTAMGKATFR
jgi:hypothetical protein